MVRVEKHSPLMRARRQFSRLIPPLLIIVTTAVPGGLTVSFAQLAPPGGGEVHALVIGVDHYATRRNLRGAVADARDIEQALKKGGVRDFTVLIDAEASRREVEAAMDRLVTSARPGDLIIISFAGHGSQSSERIKGSDPDGVDEVFVLPAFDDRGPGTAERILDKEINVWLKRIERKGAYTLFLADTCHGGGLTRKVDLRTGELSYRQTAISIAPLDDALTPISTQADRMQAPEEFDRVTFLAAADKWTKAPELRIEGQPTPRGALSYAVARALEGAANRSGDGRTTRRQLFEYARQLVLQYSQGRQAIYTEPNRRTDLIDTVVFRQAGAAASSATAAENGGAETVRLAILNGSASDLAGVQAHAAKLEVVGRDQQPDLLWDVAAGDVISALGDVVARGVMRRDIADILDRTAAVAAIARMSESRSQRIVLLPNDKHHRRGEQITFRADDVKGKWIILFNVAGDGTIQFQYPKPWDKNGPSASSIFQLPGIQVMPPLGADHVVAIVSEKRLPGIEDEIKAFDNVRAAGRIPSLLHKHLPSDQLVRIGFAGLFTTPD
jgi:hypothetical protein